ncbi:MAG: serine hydroxymethyltransferase [Candidatus Sumerlaeia bacterium]|nr:serine hydroxymethyltransferase [Candidatus Sumerlaeia bacterium]
MSQSLTPPSFDTIKAQDPTVAEAITEEITRQLSTLEMIASENFASRAVLEAASTVFTNKYAEGYPGKRYYNGCEPSDKVENLAISRACELFGAAHANVQPHSGSTANQAIFFATMKPGDTVLSLSLASGGHLSHGHRVNMAGQFFNIINYGLNKDTELINYDKVASLAREHKPRLIITGGSAYPRLIDFAKFREIADEVGAVFLTDMAHFSGLVAGKAIPSPVPHSHIVSSTTHKTLRGPRSGIILTNEEWAKPIDKAVFPGLQGGPLVHIIAAKAIAFGEALTPAFQEYSKLVIRNAQVLGEVLVEKGLRLVSGGTDTHVVLVDLRNYKVTGKDAANALEHAGITVNKNAIPFDPEKEWITSGIRIGTPALTSRGMKEDEMRTIGGLIAEVVKDPSDEATQKSVRARVSEMTAQFPLRADEK